VKTAKGHWNQEFIFTTIGNRYGSTAGKEGMGWKMRKSEQRGHK